MKNKNNDTLARAATPESADHNARDAAHLEGRPYANVSDVRQCAGAFNPAGQHGSVSDPMPRPTLRVGLILTVCLALCIAASFSLISQFGTRVWPFAGLAGLAAGLAVGVVGPVLWRWALFNRDHVFTEDSIETSENRDRLLDELDQKIEQVEDARWQLDERVQRYRDLLDQHQDMIVRLNSDGEVTFANRAFCQMFGVDLKNVVGRRPRDDIAQVLSRHSLILDKQAHTQITEQLETENGTRWIAWQGQAIDTNNGLERQYDGRDVTDDVTSNQALKEARDEAQQANRAKSRFLASMSHEIRTPMNGILGMAQLLQNEPLTRQQTTYVDAIDLSARNLLTIIDEILDYSKIEAGRLVLSDRRFSIEHIVLSVAELLAPGAHKKGLELAWTVHPDACGAFVGDSARVRQILLNLVSNAVKYTDRGGIAVTVQRGPKDEALATGVTPIIVRVTDTGIGLSEQEQRSLFSEFSQTDQALKRQAGGTGLGLAISRRLAKAMGGSLTVKSAVGAGSTFTAELYLREAETGEQNARTLAHHSQDTRVLLAFDRPIERAALRESLEQLNVHAVSSTLSKAAGTLADAKVRAQAFTHLVVDDRGDPEVAGKLLASLQTLAAEKGDAQKAVRGLVMVDMLSRDRLPEFEVRGFEGYLVRPIRPQALLEQLSKSSFALESETSKPHPDLPVSAEPTDRPLRFLLVEDNDINALLVEKQLRQAGHTIERDATGADALSRIRRCLTGREAPFDVILMDVLLPEMDGLEATRMISKLYRTDLHAEVRPPIIALTANAFEEDRQRCLEAGMDDYLAKPFDQQMLQAVLARCLAQRRDAVCVL